MAQYRAQPKRENDNTKYEGWKIQKLQHYLVKKGMGGKTVNEKSPHTCRGDNDFLMKSETSSKDALSESILGKYRQIYYADRILLLQWIYVSCSYKTHNMFEKLVLRYIAFNIAYHKK